ncbi:glycosyltransferase family 4 protein [Butyrivibrio fibrisolvens]|uniref:glycosyltransferase family 4 protein n=1 Tax=Butyrivibrio fibrisolvens TaxID=831 RepID=UPI00040E48C3|nr:glycosyltransferase family 4 protein [Butyrivibrio fibrisolvens]
MKILIVRAWPYEIDLKTYNVQEIGLARALVKKGHSLGIVLYLAHGKSYTEEYEQGITIYHQRGLRFLKNGIYPGLKNIIKSYDIIQTNEYDQLQSWFLYAFQKNKKVVIYHGPYYNPFNRGYNLRCKIFDTLLLNRFRTSRSKSTLCLTKSPQAADLLKSKGFVRVEPVGVGLDISRFNEQTDDPANITLPYNKINVIYVGKLEKRRNTEFLLDIFDLLASNDRIMCTLIGSGDREYVSGIMPRIKELEQKGCLRYYEKASQPQLKNIYKQADIMLFPSNYEIFGMVLLEAMYYGCAVISSPNGGALQLITDNENGIICDSFNLDEWVDKTTKLIDDHVRLDAIKVNAMHTISNMYTWDQIATKIEKMYQTLE